MGQAVGCWGCFIDRVYDREDKLVCVGCPRLGVSNSQPSTSSADVERGKKERRNSVHCRSTERGLDKNA